MPAYLDTTLGATDATKQVRRSSALTPQMAEALKHVGVYQDNDLLNEFVIADIADVHSVDAQKLERYFWEEMK